MNSSIHTTVQESLRADASGAVTRVARIAAFAAFAAISAQFAVTLPYTPVPITMQTLFVVLAGVVLGPRDGFYAMVTYLAAGVMGAPVFAGLSFGPAIFAGPTGGYLMAFPAAALLAGAIGSLPGVRILAVAAGAASGSLLILVMGTLYLSLITGLSFAATIPLAFAPFIAGDVVKTAVAVVIAGKGR